MVMQPFFQGGEHRPRFSAGYKALLREAPVQVQKREKKHSLMLANASFMQQMPSSPQVLQERGLLAISPQSHGKPCKQSHFLESWKSARLCQSCRLSSVPHKPEAHMGTVWTTLSINGLFAI